MIDIRKGLGESIKKNRLKRNITQENLGFMTGLHRTYISEVERGLRNISLENIYKITLSLDMKMRDLFKDEESW